MTSIAYFLVVLAIVTETNRNTNTETQKYTRTNTTIHILLRYDMFQGLSIFSSYLLLSLNIINMTLSPSLLANGCQLGCPEEVISHCPLCPEKLSTEICITLYHGKQGKTDITFFFDKDLNS